MQEFIVFISIADFIEFAKLFPCKCFNTAPAPEGEFKHETLTSTAVATKTKRLVRKFKIEKASPIVRLTFYFGIKVCHKKKGVYITAESCDNDKSQETIITPFLPKRGTVIGFMVKNNMTPPPPNVTVPAINLRLKGFLQEEFVEKLFIFPLDNTYGK